MGNKKIRIPSDDELEAELMAEAGTKSPADMFRYLGIGMLRNKHILEQIVEKLDE